MTKKELIASLKKEAARLLEEGYSEDEARAKAKEPGIRNLHLSSSQYSFGKSDAYKEVIKMIEKLD